MWTILGTFASMNGQFKVTARRGAQVVHVDHLSAADAATITQERIQEAWQAGVVRPAPRKCSVSA